jgi:enoyl-[acyl-carrier-protein] reductase (NADH)
MTRISKQGVLRDAAVWLVSDASSYITGIEIVVDSGYTIW